VVESGFARALVSGRVQGVGFRWHTRALARELGLSGWCANLSDGRVEVCCEGAESRVAELLAWLARGPAGARVEHVRVEHERAAPSLSLASSRQSF
jgi:acylphosphatase